MTRLKLFLMILLFPFSSIAQVKDTTAAVSEQTRIYESLFMKNYSKKLVKEGNVRAALDFLSYSLPTNLENPNRPFVPEALDQLYNVHYNEDHYAEIIDNSLTSFSKCIFTDDGSIMAGISGNGQLVNLYSIEKKKSITNIALHESARSVAFSHGGKIIYIHFLLGKMMKINLDNSQSSEIPIVDTTSFKGMNVSSDGKYMLAYSNSQLKVYDLSDYTTVAQHDTDIRVAKFAPDGSHIFLVSNSGKLTKYNFIAKSVSIFNSITSAENAAISHCGNYLAIIPLKGKGIIEIWNADTQKLVIKRKVQNFARNLEFSSDDSKIFVASLNELRSAGGVPDIFHMWHNNNILDVKISKDNKYIVTAGFDYTARLWYASNGKPVCAPLVHKRQAVRNVDFSPCGKYLITLPDDDSKVHIWDVESGKELPSYITVKNGKFYTAEFSPRGNYILTTSNNVARSCLLWDFKTQRVTYPLLPHQGGVFYATFSADGKYVATSSAGYKAKVWNIKDHKAKYTADLVMEYTHTQNLRKVVFSPDNSMLAFFGTKDPAATVLDIKTGKVIGKDFRHNDHIMDVAFSKNGKMLATGSMDSVAVIWNIETGKPAVEPIRHKGKTGEVKFFSDDKYLAVACWNGYAAIWNTSNGKLAMPYLKHTNRVSDIAFSSDETFMVTGSLDRSAKIWKFISPSELMALHHNKSSVVVPEINLEEDAYKAVYYITEAEIALHEKDTSRAVSLLLDILPDNLMNPNKKLSVDALQFLAVAYNGSNSPKTVLEIKNASKARYSNDGKYLAVGTSDGKLHYVDADSYNEIFHLQLEAGIKDLVFANNNRQLVILDDNGNISVYDINKGKYIGKKMSHKGAFNLLISNNGDKVASYNGSYISSEDETNKVKIWNVTSGKLITESIPFKNYVATVSFSANDETVFITSPGENARLYDASNFKKLVHSVPPADYICHGEIDKDNNYLVSIYQNEVRVSSYNDGYLVYDPIQLPGSVVKTTISPDSKYIAVRTLPDKRGINPVIYFFDLKTGKPVLYPIKVNTRLRDIEFSETPGRLLIKGDNIQVWDINLSVPVTSSVSPSAIRASISDSVLRNGSNELVLFNKDFVAIYKLTEMQEIMDFYRSK